MRKIIVIAALVLLVAASSAFAQQNCQDLRALYHMNLFVNPDTNQGGWFMDAEPVRGLLDQQPVSPTVEFKEPPTSSGHGVVGHDRGGTNIWHFANGTFTTGDWHAVYPNQPGKAGLWQYNGTGKIVGGTDAFKDATGTITETGPYIVWFEFDNSTLPCVQSSLCVRGKYFATIVARVCTR